MDWTSSRVASAEFSRYAAGHKLTNGVTLPSAPPLAKAGAVQHVPFFVAFVEGLVNIIRDPIHDTLVCPKKQEGGLCFSLLNPNGDPPKHLVRIPPTAWIFVCCRE